MAIDATSELKLLFRRSGYAHDQLAIAQETAPHSAAISTATAASRSNAERRRIEGETLAGGWDRPGWWW